MKCAFCGTSLRLRPCRMCLRSLCIKHRLRVEDGHKVICKWDCGRFFAHAPQRPMLKEGKNALA